MFLFFQVSLNNLIILIEFVSNELIYEFHIRDILGLLIDLLSKDLNRLRFIK